MQLKWLFIARADRREILAKLERVNPSAALTTDQHISKQLTRLLQFPQIGRLTSEQGMRELVINRTPYVALYRVEQNAIHILRLLHAAHGPRTPP